MSDDAIAKLEDAVGNRAAWKPLASVEFGGAFRAHLGKNHTNPDTLTMIQMLFPVY